MNESYCDRYIPLEFVICIKYTYESASQQLLQQKKRFIICKTAQRCIGKGLCWVDISSLFGYFFCPQMLAVFYANKGVSL